MSLFIGDWYILDHTQTNQYSATFTDYYIPYTSAPSQESFEEGIIDCILYKLLVFNVSHF
jgi:hypothetical protein